MSERKPGRGGETQTQPEARSEGFQRPFRTALPLYSNPDSTYLLNAMLKNHPPKGHKGK